MSNREIPSSDQHLDGSDEELTPFDDSMRRLFDAVDRFKADEREFYYSSEWAPHTPSTLGAFTVMRLVATGARRQELDRGQFGQAQYRLTEYDSPQFKPTSRFTWLKTTPEKPGEETTLLPDDLDRRLGYREFDSREVIKALAARAMSLSEINLLTEEITARGIDSSPELDEALKRLANRHSFRGLSELDAILENEISLDELSRLITLLDDLDPDLTHGVQSRLLGKLLRGLVRPRKQPSHYSEIHPTQDNAAAILETSLQQGILSRQPTYADRVLRAPQSYRYPFATELLSERLEDTLGKSKARTFLNTERTLFVHDFMMMVLQGRMRTGQGDPAIRQRVETFLQSSRILRFGTEPITFESIKAVATQNNAYPNIVDPREQDTDAISGLTGVGAAFYEILQSLQHDDIERASQEDVLDRKRAHIVETILAPTIQRKLDALAKKSTPQPSVPTLLPYTI